MVRNALKHRIVTVACLLSLIFIIGGAGWAYAKFAGGSSGPFIIHFNDTQGITQVGGSSLFLAVGILGALIVVMNFFIAMELIERDRFFGILTAAMTLLFAVLLFIGFVAILNLN